MTAPGSPRSRPLDLIRANLQRVEKACVRHQVEELSLFGSAARDDFEPGRSDLDFLVKFRPLSPVAHKRAYFGLLSELQDIFDMSVDLIEADAVRNPFVKQSIEATREPLYAVA